MTRLTLAGKRWLPSTLRPYVNGDMPFGQIKDRVD